MEVRAAAGTGRPAGLDTARRRGPAPPPPEQAAAHYQASDFPTERRERPNAFLCEWCDAFMGTFAEVEAHEATCAERLRRAPGGGGDHAVVAIGAGAAAADEEV